MKTITPVLLLLFILLSCTRSEDDPESQVIDMHNSMIALDWEGHYAGVLPCADCEGIDTRIKINRDLTYEKETIYLGKSDSVFTQSGTFHWSEDGGSITLDHIPSGDSPSIYMVGENMLIQLDLDGNKIAGELSEYYILRKSKSDS
jgi:copper homeostasis protein (lipoprotein)